MFSVAQDLRFSLRQLRRSPSFTITVVLTLAIGIGAATAIFSLVDGILLRPLAFPEVDRLVAISTLEFPAGAPQTNPAAGGSIGVSYPNFFDWRQRNHSFASLACSDPVRRLFSKMDGDDAAVITGGRVSANLFSTLGVAPALGRTFTQEEEEPGHRVVILSHELWVSDFASSPNVLGQTVKISDEISTVVGVMPAGFRYPVAQPAYFWASFAADADGPKPTTALHDWNELSVVGRFKPGITWAQALADLNTIQRGIARQYPQDQYKAGVALTSVLEDAVGDVRPALLLLLTAVGVVLLIGCTNVAGLLLARASGRRPELALRTALGASRPRIVRQLLMEALLLAFAGGALGILISFALFHVGLGVLPLPRLFDVTTNGRVLLFAIAASLGTAIIFGLLPAWRISRQHPADVLKESGSTITSGRQRNRLHQALVIVECALGFTLLIGAGLLIHSLINILIIKPGFDTEHTVAFDVALTDRRYPNPAKVPFYSQLLPKLAALPGVVKVGAVHPLPLYTPWHAWENFTIPGHLYPEGDLPGAVNAVAEPGYFETLSIPLQRGRTFTQHDNARNSPLVAVINQTFARRFFPGQDPIGLSFVPQLEDKTPRQIVGVVGDTRTGDFDEPYQPEFFLPYAQNPSHQRPLVTMKVAGDPLSYENAVRKIVAGIDKDGLVFRYQTLTTDIANAAVGQRFEAMLVSSFAGLALLLSALGLYAVLSYVVAERTRELGLRMALGATRLEILRIVLKRGLGLSAIGIGVGALTSVFATRLITDFLFKVRPLDVSVYLIVTTVLIFVSIAAALAPALRAASLDPMRTLRQQ